MPGKFLYRNLGSGGTPDRGARSYPGNVKDEIEDLIARTQVLADLGQDYAAFQSAQAANRALKAAVRELKAARSAA